jgi:hypothetical protein
MLDDRASLMAAVNEEIRVLASRLGDHPDWSWPFVCECGEETCEEPAMCSLGTYDEIRREHRIVLARGHEAAARAQAARARANELVEQSAELRAESEDLLRRRRVRHAQP